MSRADTVMTKPTTIRSTRAAGGRRSSFAADLIGLFHDLFKATFDRYQPELHYMRGPGPKWRAKHAPAPAATHTGLLLVLSRLPACARPGSR
jgi:hypothetical protein